jgi:siroheme synthase-like protein
VCSSDLTTRAAFALNPLKQFSISRPPAMSDGYYPVFIRGAALESLVVGGGRVAQRKVAALAKAGARVTVVSPDVTAGLASMAKNSGITWIADRYRKKYLKGKRLVVGATNDEEVNERISRDSQKSGALVNIVDDPARCTFIVPSVFSKGPLTVAVGTGGAAPAVAAMVRRQLAAAITNEYVALANELKKLRPRIKLLSVPEKKRFWKAMAGMSSATFQDKPGLLRQAIRAELKSRGQTKGRRTMAKRG